MAPLVIRTSGRPLPWIARSGPRAGLPLWVVEEETGHWLWLGRQVKGYGAASRNGHSVSAQVAVYEALVGPVPDGLVLDHLCRTPLCVNPVHMEPVTQGENVARGVGPAAVFNRELRCKHGHDLSAPGAITTGKRRCRVCWNAYMRDYKRRNRRVA